MLILPYTEVRENIWHIFEDQGVCCTLLRGRDLAVLVDTGYGVRNLRAFVEANISTPYMVINTHGHPDHVGGNHWFDCVYISREDMDTACFFIREDALQESCPMKPLTPGARLFLGGLTLVVIPMEAHTRGSIGLLVEEEKLLIAGDALNDWLWLFHYGSQSMDVLYDTLKKTMDLDFHTYLGGHSDREYTKAQILAHLRNIEHLTVDKGTIQSTMGFDTYTSTWQEEGHRSVISFTEDKIPERLIR